MLSKLLYWGVALLAFITIGGYFLLFPSLSKPPQIARDLPSNFSEADEEFGRRVFEAFPLPLTVDEVIGRLSEQGFSVNAKTNYATFKKSKFPCALIWRIHWETEDGFVSEITPKYGGACL